jgi:hypothetical protein
VMPPKADAPLHGVAAPESEAAAIAPPPPARAASDNV